jgi:hypothetical protein
VDLATIPWGIANDFNQLLHIFALLQGFDEEITWSWKNGNI